MKHSRIAPIALVAVLCTALTVLASPAFAQDDLKREIKKSESVEKKKKASEAAPAEKKKKKEEASKSRPAPQRPVPSKPASIGKAPGKPGASDKADCAECKVAGKEACADCKADCAECKVAGKEACADCKADCAECKVAGKPGTPAKATSKVTVTRKSPPPPAARRGPVRQQSPQERPVPYLGLALGSDIGMPLRGHLGLPAGVGILVDNVLPGSPAAKAGLERFDVVVGLDEQILVSPEQLQILVRLKKPGDAVTVRYLHKGQQKAAEVRLEPMRAPMTQHSAPVPKTKTGPQPWNHTPLYHGGQDRWMQMENRWRGSAFDAYEKDLEKMLNELNKTLDDPETREKIKDAVDDALKRAVPGQPPVKKKAPASKDPFS